MANKWTPEQQLAIEADSGTVLVSAAAGSGKTSVLVERIVRKLTREDNPCAPSELIVVTFTNAAAAEMRYRIHKRLSEIVPQNAAEHRRNESLKSRLDEMQVSTMDAFCMRLVKENFHACGVEPDFSVLENGESTILKNTAAAQAIEQLFASKSEGFNKLSKLFQQGRSDDLLIKSIIKLSNFAMSEPEPNTWLSTVADNFTKCPPNESVWGKIIIELINEQLLYCQKLIDSAFSDIEDDENLIKKIYPVLLSDKDIIKNSAESFNSLNWDEKYFSLQKNLACLKSDGYKTPSGYANEPFAKRAKAKRDRCINLFADFCDLMCVTTDEHFKDLDVLIPAAKEMIAAVKLFNSVLSEQKKELNKYDYSDISHFALSLLYDENAPDHKTPLAREMSTGIREILIDEYQDTNRAQDTLFNCLSTNGLNMFMVGDVKQSIYRFRLASPELFIEKCNSYPYYDGKAEKSKIILSKNFRSRAGVVDAVNFMFSSLLSEQCGEINYNDDEKLYCGALYPQSPTPDCELYALENGGDKNIVNEGIYIASLIKQKLKNGLTVFENGTQRPAKYSDFCILLRASKNAAPALAEVLRKNGVPVFVESKDGFFETAEIKTALSLLKAVDNPRRDVELLSVMLSPVFGFTPDDAARVQLDSKKILGKKAPSLYAGVLTLAENGDEKCIALRNKLLYWRRLSATLSVGEFVRSVIYDSSYLQLSQALSEGMLRKNNLLLLCEYADKYCTDFSKSTGGFIRYLELLRQNNAPVGKACGSAENSVPIMTIHHSKGLEFPFVIIAGLTQKFNTQDLSAALVTSHTLGIGLKMREPENIKSYNTLSNTAVQCELKNASMSEELRIMYVAMTRAKEKLIIVISRDKCAEVIEKYASLLPSEEKIPPCVVRNVNSLSEWFLSVFAKHPNANELRSYGGYIKYTDEKALIKLVLHKDIASKNDETVTETAEPDVNLIQQFSQKLGFSYKYKMAAYTAAKHTASALAKDEFSQATFAIKKPAFMCENEISSQEAGTASHLFLQFCDFDAAALSAEDEMKRLVNMGRLTQRQANGVDLQSVQMFVNSQVMQRIKHSPAVYREQRFTMLKGVCELDSSVPASFADEKTVVIGKIDLVFEEDGKAVVVDYKTDNISDVNVLLSRYSDQIKIYAEAVKKCMGLEVKESILYSLKLKKYVSL